MIVDYDFVQPWTFKGYRRVPISNYEWDSVPIQQSIQEYVDKYGTRINKGTPIKVRAFFDDVPENSTHLQVLVQDIPVGNAYLGDVFKDMVGERIQSIFIKIEKDEDSGKWTSYMFFKKDEV